MPQTPWKFAYEGDPYVAITEAEKVPGISTKELISLQELIFHACECYPVPTWVAVAAVLDIEPSTTWDGNQCSIRQQVTFDAVASDGIYSFTPTSDDPAQAEEQIDSTKIARYVRWSWHNATDQPKLSGATAMSGCVTQEIQGQRTITRMEYSFPYNAQAAE